MEIIKASLMAAVGGGGSGANLGSVTFTENDTYTPTQPLDGWDEVTVNVPTYEDEYRDALERIAELEEQVEECDQCKADVIAKLQEYDPNFDPQTCEDIPPKIDEVAGYEPPNVPPRADVIDAIAPLGGGDVDTVGSGTIGDNEYTYRIEFAGFTVNNYTMRDPIVDQPINDIVSSTLYAGYDEGQWHAGDGGYIFPVIKITIDGVGWGYAAAPGFLNGGSGWPVVCDSEWKFGIADITAYNDGGGHRVITTFYPSGAGWTDYGIYFGGYTVSKDSVTTKIYTQT